MARHRRYGTIHRVDGFVDDATSMHNTVQRYCRDLQPNGAHYEAMSRLGAAIRAAIEEVSGKPPPWTTTYVSRSAPDPAKE